MTNRRTLVPWAEEEEGRFKAAWLNPEKTTRQIATAHGRSIKACQIHARQKGYPPKARKDNPIRWTKGSPLTERLYDLFVIQNLSAPEAAEVMTKEIGSPVTRNAILGVAKRLGWSKKVMMTNLPARHKPALKPKAPKPAKKLVVMNNSTVIESGDAPPKYTVDATVWTVRDFCEPKTILGGLKGCKWPIGDMTGVEQLFCGAQTDDGKVYCVYHRGDAYSPTESAKELQRGLRRYL